MCLLVGHTDQIRKHLLGEAVHDPELAQSSPDMPIDIVSTGPTGSHPRTHVNNRRVHLTTPLRTAGERPRVRPPLPQRARLAGPPLAGTNLDQLIEPACTTAPAVLSVRKPVALIKITAVVFGQGA